MADNPKLDRIDINILAQLQANSSMTNVRLAEAVGLSPSPCLQRVKRLEKAGFITGYRAQISVNRLTESVIIFTEVTLADHRKDDFKRFEREIAKIENLQEMHLVSGGYDYLLKFTVRNMIHYQDIISDVLEKNIGVEKYFSYIVIQTLLDRGYVPVKALMEKAKS